MGQYPWKRFWCPREGSFRLDGEGFLEDPLEEFGPITNPEARPLEALADANFLGLLGEAGSGKTQTLEAEFASGAGVKPGHVSRHFWLPEIGSGAELDRAIFETGWFDEWSKGSNGLHLFLDALDEVDNFHSQVALPLLHRLSNLPLERLFIRITCRTALWPECLDGELKSRLEKAGLKPNMHAVHELLPLRRKDVEAAAAVEGFQPEEFLSNVIRSDLVPLASKPITRRFLTSSYKSQKALPSSLVSAYDAGCQNLIEETRRDGRFTGRLDAEQRLAIAERLAAVTLLCNRQAVWVGLSHDRPATDATLDDVRGVELLRGRKLEISDSEVREVLETGLFTSRGKNRFGWSHQSFGEFLAARYLFRRKFSGAQILSLIRVPNETALSIRPQLAGTAAWLASMNTDIASVVLESDPAILLMSDPMALGPDLRSDLVSSLLEKYESAELLDREWRLFRFYRKLVYPGIADYLRKAICGTRLGVVAKREAMIIAKACGLSELSDPLAGIALDESASLPLRVTAANVVAAIGTPDSKRRLLPLAKGVPEDADDELKGAALDALWPGLIETQQLLPLLGRRRRPNHFGSYQVFLLQIPARARDEDVSVLLRWLSRLDQSYALSFSFEELNFQILERAWAASDRPEAMAEVVGALKNAHRLHFSKFRTNWEQPVERRRLLLESLTESFRTREEVGTWPGGLGIPDASDFEWMLARLAQDSGERQGVWLELLGRTFQPEALRHVDALLETAQRSEVLAKEFQWYLGHVSLKSERAVQDRKSWAEREKWAGRAKGRKRHGPAELDRLLRRSRAGESDAWCLVPEVLAIGQDGVSSRSHISSDLASTPGWSAADSSTRQQILKAAEAYLTLSDPGTPTWIGTKRFSTKVLAGISAFSLLAQQTPTIMKTFPLEVWSRWTSVLFSVPFFGQASDEIKAALRKEAYANAAKATLETLQALIDADDWFAIETLDQIWDTDIESFLLARLRGLNFGEEMHSRILRRLLAHHNEEAVQIAREFVGRNLPPMTDGERVVSTAVALFAADPEEAWPLIWPTLEKSPTFARDFLVSVARDSRRDYSSSTPRLGEHQVAELYIRLSEIFPHSADRLVNGQVGPDDEGRMLRDAVLNGLANRGTELSCDAIRSIASRLPQLDWMKWVLLDATHAKRNANPSWPKPSEILELAADRSRRLVRDAWDLQEVLVEALADLAKQLQDDPPAAPDLWEEKSGEPKHEEAISDWVKRQLDKDLRGRGIVVNREVRIFRGKRTDIRVDAVAEDEQGRSDTVTVIIENKGCWNPTVPVAMKTQLVDKYLVDNHCRHGIYLVFWFDCDAWRRGTAPCKGHPQLDSIEKLKAALMTQAAGMSGFFIRALVLDAHLKN
jgi:hypothetical protein